MALASFPVSIKPDWGFADNISANIRKTKFGDGYELRQKVGLNTLTNTWNPTWSSLTQEQADTIFNFISPKLDYEAFLWTHPTTSVVYKVVCTKISRSHDSFNNFVLSLELKQDFNPV